MKIDKLGWIVAAGLAGTMIGMGFQTQGVKIGVVDMAEVFNKSEFAVKQTDTLRNMGTARQGVLEFMRTNRTLKREDAQKFRTLSLKATPLSAAEKQELEKLKADAAASEKVYRDLQVKANPTADEQKQLTDFNARVQQNMVLFNEWAQQFDEEVRGEQEKLRTQTLDRVRESVKQIAAQQGYTVVFVEEVAPYASNDLTAEALKAMNAKK